MMFYSGLPTCCGAELLRGEERSHLPRGKNDWVISAPIITGRTQCLACGKQWLYSRKPELQEIARTETQADLFTEALA